MLAAVTLLINGTASADDLTTQSRTALRQLVSQNPAAAKCKSRAVAVLVFPDVMKAGFIFGAQGGDAKVSDRGKLRSTRPSRGEVQGRRGCEGLVA